MNPNDQLYQDLAQAKTELDRLPGNVIHRRAREAFLASAASSVTTNGDMRHSDHSALMQVRKHTGDETMVARKTRRLRMIAACLLGVLLAGGFWAVPPLRTLAQDMIDFFVPDPDDTQSTTIYFGGEPHEPMERPTSDLATMITQAPFEVRVPTVIPDGFRVEDARIDHGVAFITLACNEPWAVSITQRPLDESIESMAHNIGASAIIESVDINGAVGEYVHGAWDVVVPENLDEMREAADPQGVEVDSVWNNELPWGRLLWVADGLIFEITSAGGILSTDTPSPCAPTREMFTEIARGLLPGNS